MEYWGRAWADYCAARDWDTCMPARSLAIIAFYNFSGPTVLSVVQMNLKLPGSLACEQFTPSDVTPIAKATAYRGGHVTP